MTDLVNATIKPQIDDNYGTNKNYRGVFDPRNLDGDNFLFTNRLSAHCSIHLTFLNMAI